MFLNYGQEEDNNIIKTNNRIRLNEDDFIKLLKWWIVTKDNTDIILSDIWYDRMISLIESLQLNLFK